MAEEKKKSAHVVKQLRDSKGHFIPMKPQPKTPVPFASQPDSKPVKKEETAFKEHVVEKQHEPKVEAPVKNRKAVPFTVNALFGVIAILIAFAIVGALGTKQVLCDKGVQTEIGILKVLQADDTVDNSLWGKGQDIGRSFQSLFTSEQAEIDKPEPQRVILFTPKNDVIHVVADKKIALATYEKKRVFVTGKYNSCLQKIKVEAPQNIQPVE